MQAAAPDAVHANVAPAASRWDRVFLAALLAVQAVASVVSAHLHVGTINPDGIAYLLNAEHYLRGDFGLAVNGYWGPMFSWMAAGFLACGVEPVLAGHLTMSVTGLVFTYGAHELLAATIGRRAGGFAGTGGGPGAGLPGGVAAAQLGTVLAAAAALTWGADLMTPDLLLGGLLAVFAARVVDDATWREPRRAFAAGLWLGAAYLAKAVALPTGVGFLLIVAAVLTWTTAASWRDRARTVVLVGAGCALLALPWIVALSAHYGRPTWSTTGPIAHAVVGPGNIDRWYPTFRGFHAPEPGRLTSWEDPTYLTYATWSPLQDWTHFRHQTRVVGNNAFTITGYLKLADYLGLGAACTLLGFVLALGSRAALAAERWRWAGAGTLCVVFPYLFVYAYGERYFWPAYPFLLVSALGLALRATRDAPAAARRIAVAIVAASFALGLGSYEVLWYPYSVDIRPSLAAAFARRDDVRVAASREAAAEIRAAGAVGPICSNVGDGLYVAFFARIPCHGEEPDPSLARLDEVGARTVVALAKSPLDTRLTASPAWRRLQAATTVLSVFVREDR